MTANASAADAGRQGCTLGIAYRTAGRERERAGAGAEISKMNDPALHSADAGLSVDTGIDVAKDAADLILLKRNLHVLHDGLVELIKRVFYAHFAGRR